MAQTQKKAGDTTTETPDTELGAQGDAQARGTITQAEGVFKPATETQTKRFFEGNPEAGVSYRFQQQGGETVLMVSKG